MNWVSTLSSLVLVSSLCIFQNAREVKGHNILFFHSISTSSHRTAIWPLAEKLANNGHNLTYIFAMDPKKKLGSHPHIREITPSKMVSVLADFVADFDINIKLNDQVYEWLDGVFKASIDLCSAFYDSPEVQEWLAEPDLHYDLVLVDGSFGECGYGLIHKFKAKHILFIPLMVPFLQDPLGIVPESSSIPDVLYHAKPWNMNIAGRIISTLTPLVWRYMTLKYMSSVEPIIKNALNMSDLPPLTEIEKDVSLVLINNYFVEDYPMALPPLFQSFSGLWCSKEKLKSRKPLPQNLAKFIEPSDGFFYISLGSAVVVSTMPEYLRNHFFNSFRALPNYRFLWRWTGPVPKDTPENVLLFPWFPQHDILAHPKLKAFMTQAGRPSTQESLCHGVPLITMPIFGDQDYNADRLEYIGASINLDINTLTQEKLEWSFKEILENPRYREKMKEYSAMFKDRPIDPLENVYYWTNYVLKYNTSLLKPLGMNQTWYQRRLLDIYGIFLLIALGLIALIGTAMFFTLKFLKFLVGSNGTMTKKKVD